MSNLRTLTWTDLTFYAIVELEGEGGEDVRQLPAITHIGVLPRKGIDYLLPSQGALEEMMSAKMLPDLRMLREYLEYFGINMVLRHHGVRFEYMNS